MSAAITTAPTLEPDRHTWLQSLAYHLLPGLAVLAVSLALAPVIVSGALPSALTLYLGIILGVVPVQLGILYYLGWKRNGRLSLDGIVLYRRSVPAGQMLLLVLALVLWSGLVFGPLGPWLNGPLLRAFGWYPSFLRHPTGDISAFPHRVALTVWVIGFLGTAILVPLVEELYFRGFLLPRIPASRAWAPLVNAVLFSAYHFWSPWQVFARIIMVAPIAYVVQKQQSLRISFYTHFLANAASMAGTLPSILR